MRHTTTTTTAVAFLCLFLTLVTRAQEQRESATTAPANPLIGRWEFVSIGDKTLPADLAPYWIIDSEFIAVTDKKGEQISRNPYRLEADKSPQTIVMKVEGELERIGWFEIKDKELRILMTINTGKPPMSWDDGQVAVLRLAPAE